MSLPSAVRRLAREVPLLDDLGLLLGAGRGPADGHHQHRTRAAVLPHRAPAVSLAAPYPDTAVENESPPVACSLGQSGLAQRTERWQALYARALSQKSATRRGLRLVFDARPGVADELEALAALERECCAFATWSVRAEDAELTLEISGDSEEAVAAVRSMFATLR
jgi:hypothetical protein